MRMKISDCVEVTGAITAEEFGNRYFNGNQWWCYGRNHLENYRNKGQAYDLGDGYELWTLPMPEVTLRDVPNQFKALMMWINGPNGDELDEVVYLTDGDDPGKTLVTYTVKQ